MTVFRKKTTAAEITRTRALESIPIKSEHVQVTRLETGEVLLTFAVRSRPWMAGIVRYLGGSSDGAVTRKLQLDELGTAVWNRIDGKCSVRQMVKEFANEHQLHPKEAEVAITQFLRDLGKRGLIGLR